VTQWANLVGYQVVWFAAVCGAGRGWTWPALVTMALFAAWQLAVSSQRAADVRLVSIAILLGVVLDGALNAGGVLRYAASAATLPPGGAPLWIIALWVAFALTFNHSLRWLAGKPLLCLALGAIGGPLAYMAAARLGAASFAVPAWHGLLWLALGWALACALLGNLAGIWRGHEGRARSVAS